MGSSAMNAQNIQMLLEKLKQDSTVRRAEGHDYVDTPGKPKTKWIKYLGLNI